jgi:acetylornithine/succinyldiaminopimelate/putrescine aminotransferase
LRLAPSLLVEDDVVDEAVALLARALAEVLGGEVLGGEVEEER